MSTSVILKGDQIIKEVERALKHLHVDANTQVTLDVKNDSLVVTPIRAVRKIDIEKIIDEMDQQYGETFRALAK